MRVFWSYTDTTACVHSWDDACEVCLGLGAYEVCVLVEGARNIGDYLGAPGGSSWEVPPETEQLAYCTFPVSADVDVEAMLRAGGFEPQEVS